MRATTIVINVLFLLLLLVDAKRSMLPKVCQEDSNCASAFGKGAQCAFPGSQLKGGYCVRLNHAKTKAKFLYEGGAKGTNFLQLKNYKALQNPACNPQMCTLTCGSQCSCIQPDCW